MKRKNRERGHKLIGKLQVSKTCILGSSPSVPAAVLLFGLPV